MNNEQLAIILDKYQKILESAIEKIKRDLPEDMIVQSTNFFQQKILTCPILEEFYTLNNILRNDIDRLKPDVVKN